MMILHIVIMQLVRQTEKIFKKKIKAYKESDSTNMISLEDIANKFNIDINKLIIN